MALPVHASGLPDALFPMYLPVDEGTGVILLIDAVHPPDVALAVGRPGLDRLVEGAALGAEFIPVVVVPFPAVVACDMPHKLPPFPHKRCLCCQYTTEALL